jgi:hypothetical protein
MSDPESSRRSTNAPLAKIQLKERKLHRVVHNWLFASVTKSGNPYW